MSIVLNLTLAFLLIVSVVSLLGTVAEEKNTLLKWILVIVYSISMSLAVISMTLLEIS